MAPKHQPLRTALIGLSSTAATSWASRAHLPNLLTEQGRSKFTITALQNSSVEAAQAAIKHYNLPPDTKAYGTPEDLANDPDIDVVICNTRVDKHFETVLPSIRAGKDVFIEWPIAQDLAHADELVEAARKSGSRVGIGLQRRWLPPVLKLKELIQGGSLGKVLTADVSFYNGEEDPTVLPEKLFYFTEKRYGGNPIVILGGHSLDYIFSVLGNLVPESISSQMQIRRPEVKLVDPATGKTIKTVTRDTPDILHFTARLQPSQYVVPGASFHYVFRSGQPFPGTPTANFTITLESGQIQLTAGSPPGLEFAGPGQEAKIKVWRRGSKEAEDVEWKWENVNDEIGPIAAAMQVPLYAFADGKEKGDGWVDIEDAREIARLIDGFYKKWEQDGGL
ncbi:oxidoreductase [Westerdykella ornata]|uniref:Oxidoreductase n=1 Tax=Westerdykella ornata TaxID=318751 RepID=A0A6A6JFI1_WESOR|nr:oxidoreductase [Westerdykella ornata]KAF2275380.1 oxidoreductase [Westerdykella ornata]